MHFKEREAKAATMPTVAEIATAVVATLGPDWTVEAPHDEDRQYRHLRHRDGYGVSLGRSSYPHPDRLGIHGLPYMPGASGWNAEGHLDRVDTASATVRGDRGAAAVVSAIRSKVLPVFVPSWTAAVAKRREAERMVEERTAWLTALAKAVRGQCHNKTWDAPVRHFTGGTVKVEGKRSQWEAEVSVMLDSGGQRARVTVDLPPAWAQPVLDLLRALDQGPKA